MKFNVPELKGLLISIRNNNLQYLSVKQSSFEVMVNKEIIKVSNIFTKHAPTVSNLKADSINKLTLSNKPNITQAKKLMRVEPEIYFTIVSPMIGTFYRSPGPGEPHFIEVNDHVSINQTVCLVEAMKLMNEIEAEVSGEIVEILVKDGDIIDCGQALMKIRPEK